MSSVFLELLTLGLVLDIWRRVWRARPEFEHPQGFSAAISFVTSLLVLRVLTFAHSWYETSTGEPISYAMHTVIASVQLLTIGFLYAWLLLALPGTTRTVMRAMTVHKSRQTLKPSAVPTHSQGNPIPQTRRHA